MKGTIHHFGIETMGPYIVMMSNQLSKEHRQKGSGRNSITLLSMKFCGHALIQRFKNAQKPRSHGYLP